MRKNVLVIGSGARELAIIRKLKESPHKPSIYCYGRHVNPGISLLVEEYQVAGDYNWKLIYENCKQNNIEMVVIGPEGPLGDGLADALIMRGIPSIGPGKDQSMIETSKWVLRECLEKWGMGGYQPRWKYFDTPHDVKEIFKWISELDNNYVVKLDGLCGGKGVKLSGEHIKTPLDLWEFVEGKCFLIEEKLVGEEFTLMSFCDGKTAKSMPIVKDFKRLNDGDKGPNTGSMGSISYPGVPPFLAEGDISMAEVLNHTVMEIASDELGNDDGYVGIIYGSFMKTKEGVKVIEYNARFGDPECVNIMAVLETDLLKIFNAMIDGKLNELDIQYRPVYTSCLYSVPYHYPGPSDADRRVYTALDLADSGVVPANVMKVDDRYRILSSRAVCYIEGGESLEEVSERMQIRVRQIEQNPDLHFRRDIPFPVPVSGSVYSESGVNIEEGNLVVRKIRDLVESTYNDCTISNFGDFGGLYRFGGKILVSSTDGVGTKSIPVLKYGKYGIASLGHDIVNHCVNDILVKGAEPLFFLDYFASSKINSEQVRDFVEGVSNACRLTGTVLIGGETAEMPSIYSDGHFDIAGTIVGAVDPDDLIEGKKNIQPGDIVLGLRSSGPHTNGYSLIRRCISDSTPNEMMEKLLEPHRCYIHEYRQLKEAGVCIRGMCHITGGGLVDNPPRMLPEGMNIVYNDLDLPEWVKYIMMESKMTLEETRRVLNCGVGMIFVFSEDESWRARECVPEFFEVGRVELNLP